MNYKDENLPKILLNAAEAICNSLENDIPNIFEIMKYNYKNENKNIKAINKAVFLSRINMGLYIELIKAEIITNEDKNDIKII